ncbi:class I SAM-dependent methyltransferase [Aquidulcibacter sp.]|uniref:class I SAM-dependent methyltransferase n=1 Tax=Aquidulcibacter sp. TaxID=2052990 RepID=UPI0025C2F07B|nr:class I SAM-dependent methyltransferase [Aquidulcibacter sp.]MCA3695293.1 class I SAM-dependent methyltransferase [Aquidulcibacter sp.]
MSSERDTDSDWNQLGAVDPFWAVITDERFRADKMDATTREAFYESGFGNVDQFHTALKQYFSAPDHFEACLDFGAGVGRLLVPMAKRANHAVGVDIADSMRAVCQTRLDELGLTAVELVATPKAAAAFGPFDWINSFIVLQHIPPARGMELMADLLATLRPGGFLSLQLTSFRDAHLMSQDTAGPVRKLLREVRASLFPDPQLGQISMFDYDLGQVLALLTRAGCPRFVLEHTDHGGHHGYMIYAQKAGG